MDMKICLIFVIFVFGFSLGLPVEKEEQKDDLLCEMCHVVIEDLKNLIGENATEDYVEAQLTNICNRLAAEQDVCKQAVKTYVPALFKKISGKVDPETFCQQLQVCPKVEAPETPTEEVEEVEEVEHPAEIPIPREELQRQRMAVESKQVKEIPSLSKGIQLKEEGEESEELVTEEDEAPKQEVREEFYELAEVPTREKKDRSKQLKLANNETCEICEFLVQILDMALEQNRTEAAINQTITELCNALLPELKNFCLSISPSLIKELEKGFDPQTVCNAVGLCETADRIVNTKILTCDTCKMSMREFRGERGMVMCDVVQGVCNNEGKKVRSGKPLESEMIREVEKGTELEYTAVDEPEAPIECILCKLLVEELDKIIITNKTDKEINQTVYKLCNETPDSIKNFCFEVAPKIVQVLENGVDPTVACHALRLCTADAETMSSFLSKVREEANPLVCEICEFLVTEFDRVLKQNKSDQVLNNTLYELCSDAPASFQQFCFTYAPRILQLLEAGVDPQQACTFVQLCDSSHMTHKIDQAYKEFLQSLEPLQKNIKDGKCDLCKFVIQLLDEYLEKNSSQPVINSTVYNICNSMPGELKAMCLLYAKKIVSSAEKGFDPDKACKDIQLCDASDDKFDLQAPKPHIQEQKTIKQVVQDHLPEIENDIKDEKCDLCKFVIQLLDEYLEANASKVKINATVYTLCGSLPKPVDEACFSFAPQLVTALESGFDPQKACAAVKLCSQDRGTEVVDKSWEEKPKMPEKGFQALAANVESEMKTMNKLGDPKCEICKLAVRLIDEYIDRNGSEKVINETVYKLCSFFPGEAKSACTLFAPELVKAVESGFDADRACKLTKLCSNSTLSTAVSIPYELEKNHETGLEELPLATEVVELVEKPRSIPKNDEYCQLCEFVIQILDAYLHENSTKSTINASVYYLCSIIPEALQQQCYEIAPGLVNTLSNGADPKKACAAIKLCNSTNMMLNLHDLGLTCDACHGVVEAFDVEHYNPETASMICESSCYHQRRRRSVVAMEMDEPVVQILKMMTKPRGQKGQPWDCSICEFLLGVVDIYLQDNATMSAIQQKLSKICGYLPDPFNDACSTSAENIVKGLEQGLKTQELCDQITEETCDKPTFGSVLLQELGDKPKTWECRLCMKTMQAVYDTVEKDYPNSVKYLMDICNKLPKPERAKDVQYRCYKFAQELVPFLLNFILIPGVFCLNIGMCPDQIF